MPFNQDDSREQMMRGACNIKRESAGRYGDDGQLEIDLNGVKERLRFELKSAPPGEDFGTGRDTGLAKLQSWANVHFVFAWIPPRGMEIERLWYGSPAMMRAWNEREQGYIKLDLALVQEVPMLVSEQLLHEVVGKRDTYTFSELELVVKNQWNADVRRDPPESLYQLRADVHRARRRQDNLYSHEMALIALQDRVRYLLDRGATVNNRKISKSHVLEHCVELDIDDAAASLREAIRGNFVPT